MKIGLNTTLTFKTHSHTIPSQPSLGKALSVFEIEIPTPKLRTPDQDEDGDEDDGDDTEGHAPRFIKDATVLDTLINVPAS